MVDALIGLLCGLCLAMAVCVIREAWREILAATWEESL